MERSELSDRWATPLLAGAAIAVTALAGKYGIQALQTFMSVPRMRKFYQGGFNPIMTRREAAQILGVRENVPQSKVKDAHRRVMMANHPDTGGSDYIASKINKAKDILLRDTRGSDSPF